MKRSELTQEMLKQYLHYNPDTGIFIWRKSRGRGVVAGDVAGYIHNLWGYRMIAIKQIKFRASRLAFLYMTGSIPEQVDHINHRRDDDRWGNLRAATPLINANNVAMSKNNTSGHTGVYFDKTRKKWAATIYANGRRHHLIRHKDKNIAIKARKEAEIKFGKHKYHGLHVKQIEILEKEHEQNN